MSVRASGSRREASRQPDHRRDAGHPRGAPLRRPRLGARHRILRARLWVDFERGLILSTSPCRLSISPSFPSRSGLSPSAVRSSPARGEGPPEARGRPRHSPGTDRSILSSDDSNMRTDGRAEPSYWKSDLPGSGLPAVSRAMVRETYEWLGAPRGSRWPIATNCSNGEMDGRRAFHLHDPEVFLSEVPRRRARALRATDRQPPPA